MNEFILTKVTDGVKTNIKFLMDKDIDCVESVLKDIFSDYKELNDDVDLLHDKLGMDWDYAIEHIPVELFIKHGLYPYPRDGSISINIVVKGEDLTF